MTALDNYIPPVIRYGWQTVSHRCTFGINPERNFNFLLVRPEESLKNWKSCAGPYLAEIYKFWGSNQREARVQSFFSSRPNWDPLPPPRFQRGGTLSCGGGGGGSPCSDEGTDQTLWYSGYIHIYFVVQTLFESFLVAQSLSFLPVPDENGENVAQNTSHSHNHLQNICSIVFTTKKCQGLPLIAWSRNWSPFTDFVTTRWHLRLQYIYWVSTCFQDPISAEPVKAVTC
jgi:hypothetical protein